MKNALVGAVVVLCLGPMIGCAVGYIPADYSAPDSGAKVDSGAPDSGKAKYDSGTTEQDTWQPEPDSGPPACTLGINYGTPQCDACMSASCCAADNACMNDSQCTALISCMNNCSDQQCYQNCTSSYPQGSQKLDAIGSCMQTS